MELSNDLIRFLDSCPAYVWVMDTELRYVYLNAASRRDAFQDAPMAFLAGKRGDDFLAHEEWEELVKHDRKVLATGESMMVEEQITGQAALSMKWPIRNMAGEIVGVGGLSFDVTDLQAQRLRAQAENKWLVQAVQASTAIVEALQAGLTVIQQQSDDNLAAPHVD